VDSTDEHVAGCPMPCIFSKAAPDTIVQTLKAAGLKDKDARIVPPRASMYLEIEAEGKQASNPATQLPNLADAGNRANAGTSG